MSNRDGQEATNVVLEHLKHLPILGGIAAKIDALIAIAKSRSQLRQVFPSIAPGMDYAFKFEAQSIYIDNYANTNPVTINFDNEPLTFQIKAQDSRFIPCSGSKQFRITGIVSAGANVNVLVLNRDMDYN